MAKRRVYLSGHIANTAETWSPDLAPIRRNLYVWSTIEAALKDAAPTHDVVWTCRFVDGEPHDLFCECTFTENGETQTVYVTSVEIDEFADSDR